MAIAAVAGAAMALLLRAGFDVVSRRVSDLRHHTSTSAANGTPGGPASAAAVAPTGVGAGWSEEDWVSTDKSGETSQEASGTEFFMIAEYGPEFFDRPVPRDGIFSVKHGLKEVIYGAKAKDAVPLSVADMDLPCAPEITEALRRRLANPTLGYTYQPSEMWEAVVTWLNREHKWQVEMEGLVFAPSVVTAAAAAIWALTEPGDAVLVMTPLYGPLQKVVEGAGRGLAQHRLRTDAQGRYTLDLQRLAADLRQERVKVLLFCNPHNPSGRCWSPPELRCIAGVCFAVGVKVISDEIWADWCLFGNVHRPFALEAPEGLEVVTLMAPSKTWNLAGVQSAFLVIMDAAVREKYLNQAAYAFLHYGSVFATEATIPAYRQARAHLLFGKGEGGARRNLFGNLLLVRQTAFSREPTTSRHSECAFPRGAIALLRRAFCGAQSLWLIELFGLPLLQ